jgi:hypothetical protein
MAGRQQFSGLLLKLMPHERGASRLNASGIVSAGLRRIYRSPGNQLTGLAAPGRRGFSLLDLRGRSTITTCFTAQAGAKATHTLACKTRVSTRVHQQFDYLI